MKTFNKYLILTCATMLSIGAQAQTWSFNASEWSCNNGGADIDPVANTITATAYQWSCVGLVYEGTKTVLPTQNRLCLTGRFLSKSDNGANPNINTLLIGNSSTEACASQLRAESVNDGQTLVVFNLSEKFSELDESELAADGTILVSKMGFYINETKDGAGSIFFVINDVQFLTEAEATALAASLVGDDVEPFTFDVSQWSCTCGSFDASATETIKAASYQWGCLGIEFSGEATVPSYKPYVVVKGTNIVDGTSNPNVYDISLNGTKMNDAQLRMTVNDAQTIAYANLSSIFDANSDLQRADGSYVLTKLGMYLQETTDEMLEVEDICFLSFDELQQLLLANQELPDFVFSTDDWSCTCGAFTVADGIITSTEYQWGCVGLLSQTAYNVDATKDYLVIRGTNLQQGTNNPCVYTLELSGVEYAAAKPLMTCTDDNTVAYLSLADIYAQAADKQNDGKFILTKLGFYLQETDGSLTVSDIAFMTESEFNAVTTGIAETMNYELRTMNYYGLQGRRVVQPTKGLYIINGKKIANR